MCLSVPMKVEEIRGLEARCSALGVERWVSLALMADTPPEVGSYLQISLGFAQQEVSEDEARQAYDLFGEILDAMNEGE